MCTWSGACMPVPVQKIYVDAQLQEKSVLAQRFPLSGAEYVDIRELLIFPHQIVHKVSGTCSGQEKVSLPGNCRFRGILRNHRCAGQCTCCVESRVLYNSPVTSILVPAQICLPLRGTRISGILVAFYAGS